MKETLVLLYLGFKRDTKCPGLFLSLNSKIQTSLKFIFLDNKKIWIV